MNIRLLPVSATILLSLSLVAGASGQVPAIANTATNPAPNDASWLLRHEGFVHQASQGGVDLLFLGDSITDWFTAHGSNVWSKYYAPRRAADFGISGDRTEHVLWRLENGELDGLKPKVVVLLIGTNNTDRNTAPEIIEGITLIVKKIRDRLPESKILLLGIFPRGKRTDPLRDRIVNINNCIAKLNGGSVTYLDIYDQFLDANGTISRDIMPDLLHPSEKGYQIWADAMEGTLARLLQ